MDILEIVRRAAILAEAMICIAGTEDTDFFHEIPEDDEDRYDQNNLRLYALRLPYVEAMEKAMKGCDVIQEAAGDYVRVLRAGITADLPGDDADDENSDDWEDLPSGTWKDLGYDGAHFTYEACVDLVAARGFADLPSDLFYKCHYNAAWILEEVEAWWGRQSAHQRLEENLAA